MALPFSFGSGSLPADANFMNQLQADLASLQASVTPLNTLTASSSATLDDTTSITSKYNTYSIQLTDVLPALVAGGSGNAGFFMRFGTGAGPTFIATNYLSNLIGGYTGAGTFIQEDSTTGIQIGSTGSEFFGVGNTANAGLSGNIYLFGANSANWKKVTGIANWYNPVGPYSATANIGGMYVGSTNVITGLRFLFASGNITSGSIKIFGVNS
jgi:hypothetical protein